MKRLNFRKINKDIFDAIKSGKKKVETRAATSKYIDIKHGETIVLVCDDESFEKKVKNIQIFMTISEMLNKYKPSDINPKLNSEEELRNLYNSFPDYKNKIDKYGLIVLELE